MSWKLNQTIAIKFTKYMLDKYDARIVQKKDSNLMRVIAGFVDTFSQISVEEFMSNYSTTFYDSIYLCFDPKKANPMTTISVLTHEIQHVIDFRKNPINAITYLTSTASRGHLEYKPMVTGLELRHAYNGDIGDLRALAETKRPYGLKDEDIEVLYKSLKSAAVTVTMGKFITEPGNIAVRWLGRYAR